MGKEKPGFMTPKAIANRIKSKGLQKLRWYCQMCEKQCRDENGFKCHTMSESHQRQLLLFADNSRRYLDEFSRDFKNGYILTLKHRFGTKRVNANAVYQEYISDRNHIHMNATKWYTLTRFVQYLGREGICNVDQTEKGWFVQYIDRDPETMRRQLELEKKHKLDIDDRERQIIHYEKQAEKAKARDGEYKPQYTELKRNPEEEGALKFVFKKPSQPIKSDENGEENVKNEADEQNEKSFDEDEDEKLSENEEGHNTSEESNDKEEIIIKSSETEKKAKDKENNDKKDVFIKPIVFKNPTTTEPSTSKQQSSVSNVNGLKQAEKRKLSALDEIMQAKEQQREKQNRKDYWLHKNIIVKIITDKLGEKYKNKKGVVMAVKDNYIAILRLVDNDAIIKVDQAHVETVLPAVGKKILIVNGAYRGLEAVLEGINHDNFTAKISISMGPLKGRILNNIQYEDISKLYIEESSDK